MKKAFEKKCDDLQNRKQDLLDQIDNITENNISDAVTECLIQYKDADILTREILVSLIERIMVDCDKKIDICFRFRDELNA